MNAMEKLQIRPVDVSDASRILELLREIIEDGRFSVMTAVPTLDEQTIWLRHVMEHGVCYVAEEAAEIAGIQSIEPISDESALGHVGDISTFVRLNRHCSGIGTRLSQAVFEAAKEFEYEKMMATIRADNPGALAFYRKLGFEEIGVAKRHAYIGGRYVDEVLMERFL